MTEQYSIAFDHVEKAYQKTRVIEDLNLFIPEGERLILLGPSGLSLIHHLADDRGPGEHHRRRAADERPPGQ